jgi:predicted ribosomally synthesized peptide with SipW-like signal peptide
MKNIIKSLLVVVAVAAIAGGATYAYFTSTASITGNTFSAGTMDILIDKNPVSDAYEWVNTFSPTDPQLGALGLKNLKPGDSNFQEIDLKNVGSVEGKATIKFDVNPATWSALADKLNFTVLFDNNNDRTYETTVATGPLATWNHNTYDLGLFTGTTNSNGGQQGKMATVKIMWSVPTDAGNEIKGKSITFDTTFGLEQVHP